MSSVLQYSYLPDVTHTFKFEVEIGCDYQCAGRRILAVRAYQHYKSDREAKRSLLQLDVK